MSIYDGKYCGDLLYIPEESYYCHNYYYGFERDGVVDKIYAWSDDDNYTEYYLVGNEAYRTAFAESFTSQHDKIHVYDEFKR